jgi:polar amino acid transport system substrate-binding protein
MALSPPELEDLLDAWHASGRVLQVGFNRRFAPSYLRLKSAFASRRAPLVMSYRVNAGPVSPSAWVADPTEGGGRLIGEVCHMVDTLLDLVGAPVTSVYTQSGSADDVLLTLKFDDASIATIIYASGGERSLPKEYLEVFGGGRAVVLNDFRTVRVHATGRAKTSGGPLARQDKGHAAELAAFVDAVRHGRASPIDPEAAAHVTRVTFAAAESARTGLPIQV